MRVNFALHCERFDFPRQKLFSHTPLPLRGKSLDPFLCQWELGHVPLSTYSVLFRLSLFLRRFLPLFFLAVNNLQFLCNYFVREFRAACFVRLSVLHLFARVKYFFSHFRMNFVKYFLSHPRDKKNNCMSKKICGQRQKYLPTPFCLYPRAPKRYYASLCLVHQIALCDLFFCTLSQHACPHTQNTACSKCKLLKHVPLHTLNTVLSTPGAPPECAPPEGTRATPTCYEHLPRCLQPACA